MKLFRLTAASFLLGSLVGFPVAGLAGEVGVFLADQPDCRIHSAAGNAYCLKDTTISAGDVIRTSKAPGSLAVQWLASGYTTLEPVAAGQYRVAFRAPEEGNSVQAILGDLLGFYRRAGRVSHSAVTRGAWDPQPVLPGDGATLLPGEPVTLSWCAAGVRKVAVRTAAGVQIKEIAVPEGERSLTMTPEELGLASAGAYRWAPVRAAGEGGRLVLLGGAAAKKLSDALLQIGQGKGSAAQQGLEKAAYLRFVSENYADRYSLGWLQYRVASELAAKLGGDDLAAAEWFKAKSVERYCE